MAGYKSLFLYGLILTTINYSDHGRADARQCYRCRNCHELSDDDLPQECPLRPTTPTESSTPAGGEGSTTPAESSEELSDEGSGNETPYVPDEYGSGVQPNVDDYNLHENGLGDDQSIDDYDLDDDDFGKNEFLIVSRSQIYHHVMTRSLKQWRNDEDQDNSDARCIVSAYEDPETQEINTVRDCVHIRYDELFNAEARCRELIGNGVPFAGTLQRCLICNRDECNSAGKTAGAILLVAMCLAIKLL